MLVYNFNDTKNGYTKRNTMEKKFLFTFENGCVERRDQAYIGREEFIALVKKNGKCIKREVMIITTRVFGTKIFCHKETRVL